MNISLPGFTDEAVEVPKQLVVCVNARQRRGKTHFSLKTVPGPVVYIPTEIGFAPVLARIARKDVHLPSRHNEFIFDPTRYKSDNEFKVKAKEMWMKLRAAFKAATKAGSGVGTCVLDTGSAANKLCQYGYEGPRQPRDYGHSRGMATADWQSMIQSASLGSTHVLITHRLKAEWDDNAPTGNWEAIGHKEIAYDTMMAVVLDRGKDGKRYAEIQDCRHKPELDGERLVGKKASFAGLFEAVFDEPLP